MATVSTKRRPASGLDWAALARKRVGNTGLPQANAPSPVQPLWPTAGSYDPTIKANAASAQRGLGDLQSDYVRDFGELGTALGGRQGADYLKGRGDVQRQSGETLADLLTAGTRGTEDFAGQRSDVETTSGRTLADLLTSRQRGQESHDRSVQDLSRQYGRLGHQQEQGFRAAGLRGGAQLQATAKRSANEAYDRQPIDTNLAQFLADSHLSESRLGEDKSRSLDRIGTAESRFNTDNASARDRLATSTAGALEGLDTTYLRGGQDAADQLARAMRENGQFQLASQGQAIYQAGPAFQSPPAPKKTKKKAKK